MHTRILSVAFLLVWGNFHLNCLWAPSELLSNKAFIYQKKFMYVQDDICIMSTISWSIKIILCIFELFSGVIISFCRSDRWLSEMSVWSSLTSIMVDFPRAESEYNYQAYPLLECFFYQKAMFNQRKMHSSPLFCTLKSLNQCIMIDMPITLYR